MRDELKYAVRHELDPGHPRLETVTLRHSPAESRVAAAPGSGSFLPGAGVGGAGEHWNGVTWPRLSPPSDPTAAQPLTER